MNPLALLPPGAKLMPLDPMALLPPGAKLMPPDRSLLQRGVRGVERGAEATAAGLVAPIVGLSQAIDAPLSRIPGLGVLGRGANHAAAADIRAQNAAPIPGLVASTFNPLYLALPEVKAATTGATLARAAGLGGAVSAAQPTSGQHPSRTRLENTAAGVTLGGALGGAAHGATKAAGTVAAELARKGIPVRLGDFFGTAGAIGGHMVGFTPGRIGQAYVDRRVIDRAQWPLIFDWVLEPTGLHGPKETPAGRAGIEALQDVADRAYSDALGTEPLAWPKFIAAHLAQVRARGWSQHPAETLVQIFGLDREYSGLPVTAQDSVRAKLRQFATRDFEAHGIAMPPRELKGIQSSLRAAARGLLRSSTEAERDAGRFLRLFGGSLTDAIADGNPERAAGIRAADAMWARLAIVENAVPATGTEGRAPGVVPIDDLLQNIRKADPTVRHRAFAAGNAQGQREFERVAPFIRDPRGIFGLSPLFGGGAAFGIGNAIGGPVGAVLAAGGTTVLPWLAGEGLRPVLSSARTAPMLQRAISPLAAALASENRR